MSQSSQVGYGIHSHFRSKERSDRLVRFADLLEAGFSPALLELTR